MHICFLSALKCLSPQGSEGIPSWGNDAVISHRLSVRPFSRFKGDNTQCELASIINAWLPSPPTPGEPLVSGKFWTNDTITKLLFLCLSPLPPNLILISSPHRAAPRSFRLPPTHTHSSKRDSSSKHRACHFTLSGGREEASSARSHTEPSSPFTACTAVPELIPAVEGMGNVTPTQTAGLNSKDA